MRDRMEPDASDSEASVESEFTTTARYLELYMRQKTDLFLQHYVFDPFTLSGNKAHVPGSRGRLAGCRDPDPGGGDYPPHCDE